MSLILKMIITFLTLNMLGKISTDNILKYFSQKTDFDFLCKLSPIKNVIAYFLKKKEEK